MSYITQALTVLSVFNASTQAFTIPPSTTLSTTFTPFSTSTTPNYHKLHMSTTAQMPLAEGLLKTILKEGNGTPLKFGDVATVQYTCSVIPSSPTTSPNGSLTTSPFVFSSSRNQKVVVGDNQMIPGWELALQSMTVGEKSTVLVQDSTAYGYGPQGVPPVIPGGAVLEIEMEVLAREDAPTMGSVGALATGGTGVEGFFAGGSGDLGALDPSKPRTPQAIAAAYKSRQESQALNADEPLEGLEYWINKLKTSYFFGLFEGETGEATPWILRPSITFPLVFLIVGLTLVAVVLGGGVSERGLPTTDDLDDIVLSWNVVSDVVRDVVV